MKITDLLAVLALLLFFIMLALFLIWLALLSIRDSLPGTVHNPPPAAGPHWTQQPGSPYQ